jgi:hypothetical protein
MLCHAEHSEARPNAERAGISNLKMRYPPGCLGGRASLSLSMTKKQLSYF